MERKIGEIFEYNGEWYQCVRSILTCSACEIPRPCTKIRGLGYCSLNMRNDKEQVVFKKLEKVGEPIVYMSRTFQRLKLPDTEQCKYCYFKNQVCNPQLCGKETFLVEIKQTKEDMEEKKLNLKPFDLEAAKAGKPVCTRDGRKARIICFDVKAKKPIAALITNDDTEEAHFYYDNGRSDQYQEYRYDLMMLPEKKEGWINIYNADTTFYYVDGRVFETKDEAVKEAKEEVEKEQREKNEYIDTIRVEWEE